MSNTGKYLFVGGLKHYKFKIRCSKCRKVSTANIEGNLYMYNHKSECGIINNWFLNTSYARGLKRAARRPANILKTDKILSFDQI